MTRSARPLRSLLSSRSYATSASLPPNATPFQVLNLPHGAPCSEVKQAYYKLVKLHHPDAHAASGKGSAEANKERFLKIQKAYECLGNEKGRGLYLSSRSGWTTPASFESAATSSPSYRPSAYRPTSSSSYYHRPPRPAPEWTYWESDQQYHRNPSSSSSSRRTNNPNHHSRNPSSEWETGAHFRSGEGRGFGAGFGGGDPFVFRAGREPPWMNGGGPGPSVGRKQALQDAVRIVYIFVRGFQLLPSKLATRIEAPMGGKLSFAVAYRFWEVQMAQHVAERNHRYASTALEQSREDAGRRGDWRPAVRKRLQEMRDEEEEREDMIRRIRERRAEERAEAKRAKDLESSPRRSTRTREKGEEVFS